MSQVVTEEVLLHEDEDLADSIIRRYMGDENSRWFSMASEPTPPIEYKEEIRKKIFSQLLYDICDNTDLDSVQRGLAKVKRFDTC